MTKQLAVLVLAALVSVFGLTGCGEDDEPKAETHTAANGDEYNDADVEFATGMIPHHAEALAMVDLTRGRPLDPPVQRLAEKIMTAQAPEIETMVGWLNAWDEEVPETMRDHANAHSDEGHSELSDLEEADDAELQQVFLERMIEHHEGAVEMARTQQDDGLFPPAVELAEAIEASQQKEIAKMEALLGS